MSLIKQGGHINKDYHKNKRIKEGTSRNNKNKYNKSKRYGYCKMTNKKEKYFHMKKNSEKESANITEEVIHDKTLLIKSQAKNMTVKYLSWIPVPHHICQPIHKI